MTTVKRWLLIARWVIGHFPPFVRQEWRVRYISDTDTFEELKSWIDSAKAEGWDDMAAFGKGMFFRKFVNRWPHPSDTSIPAVPQLPQW